jgi:predicted transcriptional regulator
MAFPLPQAEPEKPEPAVSIRKSITPDFLISLEDSKRYKTLRRHLTGRGLTPEQYREKWGLPRDYPMVAGKRVTPRERWAAGHLVFLRVQSMPPDGWCSRPFGMKAAAFTTV